MLCIRLETTQAMLWFSIKSIIQKNGNIGIFSMGAKIVGNNSKFYFSPLETSDNSNSFLIAATTWSYEP